MAKKNSTLTSQAGRWLLTDRASESGTKSDDSPNEIRNTSTPRTLIRHPNFFFDNVLVAIQIEDTLFNVHKYQLAKSVVFSDMFKMPKPKGHESEEGSSPERPIVIGGVAASDFAALLTVLYASHFSTNQPTPEAALVIPAFRLANMFDFSDLCAYLLPLAEKNLDDADKIMFAREFDIKEWLAPAHIRLCKRDAVLSTEEANKLGVNSVLLIWRMREQHRNRSSTMTKGTYYCTNCSGMALNNYSSSTCGNCNATPSHLYWNGPGTMGSIISTNDSELEAGVRQWVNDNYATPLINV
ncbi:unnamed protein product [Rhizoctonia solani]|uniref:BTB domain-containing protein n=1 Tax=Rhizoctonia solani TaxID=456999 RepID=A0A8H2XKX3_9AGAM|nr:unnamed protein product [Rhizoctonia solani]